MADTHPTDELVAAVIERLGLAYTFTLTRLAAAIRSGRNARHHRTWLAEIDRELADLLNYTTAWATGTAEAPGAVAEAWLRGARAAGKSLEAQGVSVDVAGWYVIPRDAIRIVEQNLLHSVAGALIQTRGHANAWMDVASALANLPGGPDGPLPPLIGRRVQDEFRRIGLEATARKLTEGLTVRQTRAVLMEELQNVGLTAFYDDAGRRWSLKQYASMVARTTPREAYTEGTISIIQRAGYDLVRMSEHYPTCRICAAKQGRVYSISGKHPDFPSLEGQRARTPVHGHCRHVLTAVVESYLSPDEYARLKEFSNRPFDDDPRTAQEIEAYDRSQKLNRLRLEKARLSAQRKEDVVTANSHMVRWSKELREPGTTPERKRELRTKLAEAAERKTDSRNERIRAINREIIRLNRETRAEIRARRSR